jgi:peptidoglycan/xylan/chitin deacetylase (PgdA/CDA1 family)
MAWAVRGRSSSVFGRSVWRGSPDRNSVALTFDDGPSESTPGLLEILERHNARATFFQCGVNVERLPEIARQVSGAGHEIGNHTYSHARLDLRPRDCIFSELARAQTSIEQATGQRPALFRAPYGVRWFGLGQAQERLGLIGVMWTALGRDWRLPADRIASRLSRAASPGAILCLHDGRETRKRPDVGPTLEAARRLLPALTDRGFKFETVSQILCPQNSFNA